MSELTSLREPTRHGNRLKTMGKQRKAEKSEIFRPVHHFLRNGPVFREQQRCVPRGGATAVLTIPNSNSGVDDPEQQQRCVPSREATAACTQQRGNSGVNVSSTNSGVNVSSTNSGVYPGEEQQRCVPR